MDLSFNQLKIGRRGDLKSIYGSLVCSGGCHQLRQQLASLQHNKLTFVVTCIIIIGVWFVQDIYYSLCSGGWGSDRDYGELGGGGVRWI